MFLSVMDISAMYVSTAIDSLDAAFIATVHSCNILVLARATHPPHPGSGSSIASFPVLQ